MHTVYLLLYVAACICFALAAANVPKTARPNLVALGLLLAYLVPAIQYIRTA